MKHPLDFIPDLRRKGVFIGLLIWTLVLTAFSQVINAPMKTSAAPAGIISFEFARTSANAQSMVASWNAHTQLSAALGLGFDYLYMPSYAFAIALACLLAAGRHPGTFARLGVWLGWGGILAAFLDAIENIGLWNSLFGNLNPTWPAVSFWCAAFKFGLILLGIIYCLVGWLRPKKK